MSKTCRWLVAVCLVCWCGPVLAQKLELHFVRVGQGDCTLVKFPNKRFMLVDCGSSREGSPTRVRNYLLRQLGTNRQIDTLVITHPDADHYNYLPQVLHNVRVRKVYTVGPPSEFPDNNCDTWLSEFDAADREVLRREDWNVAPARSLIPEQGGARVYVLAANVQDTRVESPKNTRSIVLKITFGTFDAILTGDATFDTERDIMQRFAETGGFLQAELLKVGHHGSRATSTSTNWTARLRPEVAVVSAAKENSYGHPAFNVITNLETYTGTGRAHTFRWYRDRYTPEDVSGYKEAIYCTAKNRNIVVESDGTIFEVKLK